MNGILLNQGGAGAVESVNGHTGEVNLTFKDLQTSQNLIITDSDKLTRITLYDPENTNGNHTEYVYPSVEVRHDDVVLYNRGQTDFLSAKLDRQDFIDFQDDFIPALNEQISSIMERLEALEALHPQESE